MMIKFFNIWLYTMSILILICMIIRLFISSETYDAFFKIMLPSMVLPYLLCRIVYFKFGSGKHLKRPDSKGTVGEVSIGK